VKTFRIIFRLMLVGVSIGIAFALTPAATIGAISFVATKSWFFLLLPGFFLLFIIILPAVILNLPLRVSREEARQAVRRLHRRG
jgi:hypothetical protein